MYEGPPARGEVFANVAMSWTIVWVPLTIAAVGRALWVNYKITDKVCTVDHLSLPFFALVELRARRSFHEHRSANFP